MSEQMIDLSMASESDDIENLYLTFEVARETYAVNISHVTEIVGMQRISAMPDVPEFIRGAMNLRGKVIPVMDVRLRFGLPWQTYDDRTTIIVLNLEGAPTGLVVDKVTDVLTISPDSIEPPTHWHSGGRKGENENNQQGVVKGLGRHQDGVSIVLDVPRLLSEKDLFINIPAKSAQSNPEKTAS
jgi:purine-binding chemotaxis protein CheW